MSNHCGHICIPAAGSLIAAGGSTGHIFSGQMINTHRRPFLIFFNMHALFILMGLQCIKMAWLESCIYTETDYVCKEIPTDYPAGLTSVILFVSALGEINSSMFNSTNLTSVTSLTMTRTGLTAVSPQTFDKFLNLQTLILDNNYLSHVSSDWFSHPEALETLRLSNNKITMLDHNALVGMTSLLTLNLSRNLIHTISQSSFIAVSKLRQLDLSNNNLTYLSVTVLRPLNVTKIRLDGNPWDCSCSLLDFARFLRGLQNASLLENEMLVRCDSPPELRGKPVWQVQECKMIPTSHTTERHVPTNPATGSPVTVRPVSISKPLTIRPSTLISLIVVLCALVLVICVLSVLYHRKRVRKRLQTVKPSPETAKTGETNDRTILSEIPTENTTRKMLLNTNRTLVGDEMISHIYHIYYQSRQPIKRVSSAGPVLCRTGLLSKQMETEMPPEEVEARKMDEYYDGCVTSEHQKDNVKVNVEEEVEQETDGRMRKESDEENTKVNEEVRYPTDMPWSCEDGFKENNDEEQVENEAPLDTVKNDVKNLTGDCSHAAPREQIVENVENLPYLTIGADPENQISVVEEISATDGRSGSLRPIRRVLTWPPTAVQWKKQWLQNQHVLNVFPKIIFVTGYGQFGHNASPDSLPAAPQFNTLEFLAENVLQEEHVRGIDGGACVESLSGNVSTKMENMVISKEETWRSDLFSCNSHVDETEICSELFTILHPSSNGRDTKLARGEHTNDTDDAEKPQSVRKKRWQDHKSEKDGSKREENTVNRNSKAPHARGSPKDVNLLLGNEYTYIDLLHEVVENHGRWTRERWRQTQKNKRKLKQGQSR